jgi:hypothetical protein
MSRIVYVGGFGGGEKSAATIGNALERHFEDVDTFTLSDWVKDPGKVRRAAKGVALMTHSATESNYAYLLNPPLPASIGKLVGRSLVKTGRLYASCFGAEKQHDIRSVSALSTDVRNEIVKHPIANLSQLPNISRFNAIDAAIAATDAGTHTTITWTHEDAYFQPSEEDFEQAAQHGVLVSMLEGHHDEVILQPEAFLDKVFEV